MTYIVTIVVTYNSVRTIDACLASILRFGPADNCIVVVDNGSTDGTIERVDSFGAKVNLVLSPRNVGFGAANNLAMRLYPASYYYLHNPDAFLIEDCLAPAIAYLENNVGVGVAGLPIIFPDGSPQTSAYAFSSPLKWMLQLLRVEKVAKWLLARGAFSRLTRKLANSGLAKSFIETHLLNGADFGVSLAEGTTNGYAVDWVTGAALLLRRTVFDETGGFDENIFLYGEDEDLCIAAKHAGFSVHKLKVAPVVHELGWFGNKKKAAYVSAKHRSLIYFIEKHYAGSLIRKWSMRCLLRIRMLGWQAFFPVSNKNV